MLILKSTGEGAETIESAMRLGGGAFAVVGKGVEAVIAE